jgi:hypothetical protein
MTVATKTKKTKVDDLRPPMELREITKARREWLAMMLAEVNARPGFEGKIVGNGSYQSVSVYSVTQVEGRLRHRGHCQFCGNSQVVQDGVMVLHGYTRPGDGYIFNECPCVGRSPLEVSQVLTEDYLKNARETLAMVEKKLEKAKKDQRAAMNAKYGHSWDVEADAVSARPRSPSRKATPEEVTAYTAAVAEWAKRFPLSNAVSVTEARVRELETLVWRSKQQVSHFETLLARKLLGKALIEEVVA